MTQEEKRQTIKEIKQLVLDMAENCCDDPNGDWIGDREYYIVTGYLRQLRCFHFISHEAYYQIIGVLVDIQSTACSCQKYKQLVNKFVDLLKTEIDGAYESSEVRGNDA